MEHSTYTVSIGSACMTADHAADVWRVVSDSGASFVEAIGVWEGTRERSVIVTATASRADVAAFVRAIDGEYRRIIAFDGRELVMVDECRVCGELWTDAHAARYAHIAVADVRAAIIDGHNATASDIGTIGE